MNLAPAPLPSDTESVRGTTTSVLPWPDRRHRHYHHRRRRPTSVGARLLLMVVHIYQAARAGRPSPCRYLPTCSVYAVEAIERHGAGRGGWLTVRRLSRCHPWGGHGADPVPELRNPS